MLQTCDYAPAVPRVVSVYMEWHINYLPCYAGYGIGLLHAPRGIHTRSVFLLLLLFEWYLC